MQKQKSEYAKQVSRVIAWVIVKSKVCHEAFTSFYIVSLGFNILLVVTIPKVSG